MKVRLGGEIDLSRYYKMNFYEVNLFMPMIIKETGRRASPGQFGKSIKMPVDYLAVIDHPQCQEMTAKFHYQPVSIIAQLEQYVVKHPPPLRFNYLTHFDVITFFNANLYALNYLQTINAISPPTYHAALQCRLTAKNSDPLYDADPSPPSPRRSLQG